MFCSLSQKQFTTAVASEYKGEDLNFALVYAASQGDLVNLKKCISSGANVNFVDYDQRSALHLAAAEGKLDCVEVLVENGVEINGRDTFGYTPLEDAVAGHHLAVARFLKSKGGLTNNERSTTMTRLLLQAAAAGDINELEILTSAGANINAGDYDKRTPIHLAASEGRVQVLEFLILKGADINAVDRFGNSPLADTYNGVSRGHTACRTVLSELGAVLSNDKVRVIAIKNACADSLPVMFLRGDFEWVESLGAYGSSSDQLQANSFESKKPGYLREITDLSDGRVVANQGRYAQAWEKELPIVGDIASSGLSDTLKKAAISAGIKTEIMLPVSASDEETTDALYILYSKTTPPQAAVVELHNFVVRMFRTSLAPDSPQFAAPPDTAFLSSSFPKGQQHDVFKKLVIEAVYSPATLFHHIDWFYRMIGADNFYFRKTSADYLAQHIHAYVAAKTFSAVSLGDSDQIWLHVENNSSFMRGESETAIVMLNTDDHDKLIIANRILQRRIAHIPPNKGYSVEFVSASQPISFGGERKLGIFTLETTTYANPATPKEGEKNIWNLAADNFLKEKTPHARNRYQEVINELVGNLAPRYKIYPIQADGTVPVMFAFNQGNNRHSAYMMQLTELLAQSNIVCRNSHQETFSNGITVFSLYLEPCDRNATTAAIDTLMRQFSMLFLLPDSGFTHLFLKGHMRTDNYAYCTAASRCVYYFINQRSDEMDALIQSLGPDSVNASRLRLLNTSMKKEAVSMNRIFEIVEKYLPLMDELTKDFVMRNTAHWSQGVPPVNDKLSRLIDTEASSPIDSIVLNAFMSFNKACLKTNFFKTRKSTLTFRLDPTLLAGNWPSTPFGIFFVMGAEFQGFHIRFEDVSRGGIRIIKSRDPTHYNQNRSTLFAENYGLAYTQNKKNKDIPEFGSKGTVLLNPDEQENGMIAFRKYISGILDLLVLKEGSGIVDNYSKPELLFMGPDENTADKMQIAAHYARDKGYPFWRSFTTGKPNSMGGIPHDTYGMTTRSVHRFVLGCLRKLNLKEEDVTKAQLGGPDGDLGSNEILISKDKTICVVDGSGVVYDPVGLNRTELTRLAKKRVMINEFDVSALGQGGFKVLIGDKNITLPDGELVTSGLAFRNGFHLHRLCKADLFVPCGGRPESVCMQNVRQYIDKDGKPRFKIVVEGANLFFTNDARMMMEQAGCVQFKDASTNKGGVTSSSCEVLAALAMDAYEFEKHMMVKDNKPGEFYQSYCKEIQQRIENDADAEFEAIWREGERTREHNYVLTEKLSDKINSLNQFVAQSALWDNDAIRHTVLHAAIPNSLMTLVGYDTLLKRVPENYLRAIFASHLASRYVYQKGISSNEFAFFDFMQKYLKK